MSSLNQFFGMKDRVAVITGSTKGMGLAIAKVLGSAGAKVILSGRNEDAAKSAADALAKADGITAHGIDCDVSDVASVRRFAKLAQEAFGRVDALVLNAAGTPAVGSILHQGLHELDETVSGAVSGNLLLINEILPSMIERKDGSIVFVSSALAQYGNKMLGMYGMAKAANDQLVRNLVAELGDANINVNSINPSTVRTDFSRILWENPEAEKRAVLRIPLGRIGEADDVAGLALLLASKAGRYITGQSIRVDGGRSAV